MSFTSKLFTVVSWGISRLDLFAIGGDKILYHKAFDNSAWQPNWDVVNGGGWWTQTDSSRVDFPRVPAAVCRAPDRLDVFGVGTADNMYRKAWDGNNWMNEWERLGTGTFTSSPSVVAWDANRLDAVALGDDRAVYHYASNDGQAWVLDGLGGDFAHPPVVVSRGKDSLDVFVVGRNQYLYHLSYN
ncbi:MAG: hypothetical protein Q9224_006880, partial [Gallowayella concinna]